MKLSAFLQSCFGQAAAEQEEEEEEGEERQEEKEGEEVGEEEEEEEKVEEVEEEEEEEEEREREGNGDTMDGAREGEVGWCCCCIKGCMGSIFSGLMLRGRGSGRREDEEEEQEVEEAGVQGTKGDEDMLGKADGGGLQRARRPSFLLVVF